MITGNGKGLAGFAIAKSRDGFAALRKARNRAGQKLMYLQLFNEHASKFRRFLVLKSQNCNNDPSFAVYHDFFTQFGKTKIFVTKKPEGYGLVCHRAIKTMCEVIGIKDLYAKVEGSTNIQHLVKAFFIGLLQQVVI